MGKEGVLTAGIRTGGPSKGLRAFAFALAIAGLSVPGLAVSADQNAGKPAAALPLPQATYNAFDGGTGLIRVQSAIVRPKPTFGLLANVRFFSASEFMGNNLSAMRLETSSNFTMSFADVFEYYFVGQAAAHRIKDDIFNTVELIQSNGDFRTGAKLGFRINPIYWMGFDLFGDFPTRQGDIGPELSATSIGGRLLATLDWTGAPEPLPLRFNLNVGYRQDNRSKLLVGNVLGNPPAEYALGVPVDDNLLLLGFSVEIPQKFIDFFVEYSTENGRDFDGDFASRIGTVKAAPPKFIANPMRITPGIRINPIGGMHIDLAVELGMPLFTESASYPFYQDGLPYSVMPKWFVHTGIGYVFTPSKPEPPALGRAIGVVKDAKTGEPLEGAIVNFPGQKLSALYTNKLGEYKSYDFASGTKVTIDVTREGYKSASTATTIVTGQSTRIDFPLDPSDERGELVVVVSDASGRPVPDASVEFETKDIAGFKIDPTTGEGSSKLNEGTYNISIKAAGFKAKPQRAKIVKRRRTRLEVQLQPEEQLGIFSGTVQDVDKKPVAATITFSDPSLGSIAVDPATGAFKVKVPAGEYVARASAAGYLPLDKRIRIVKDLTTNVDFLLESASKVGKLIGKVVDAETGKGVFAVISFPNGERSNIASDPESGQFVIDSLEEKEYEIKAASPSYQGQSQRVQIVKDQTTEVTFSLQGFKKVKVTKEKIEITQKIEFRTGKAIILVGSYPILDEVAQVMKENPEFNVVVEGHTDNVGPDAINLSLSQSRAEAVRDYLISRGIQTDRLKAVGHGETRPISSNSDEEGRARNRRVEFLIHKRDSAE